MSDEATKGTAYFIDPDGKVVSSSPEDVEMNLATGYVPASPKQIEDFKKEEAFHAKYSAPGQQAATAAEAFARPLTLGFSTMLERAAGVKAKDIKAREEENPKLHTGFTLAGVAAPLILSGGTSALSEAAGMTGPSLLSKAGEAAADLLPETASTMAGRMGLSMAKGALSAGTEGLAYGGANVVHEAALGDPNLTAESALEEIGLSGLMGGAVGAGTGALGQLLSEGAQSHLGQKLADWAENFEGNQNIKTAAGPGKGQAALKGLFKKMSPEQASQLGREAGEMGLVDTFSTPSSVFEKSGEAMESAGKKMGDILEQADAKGAEQVSAARVMSRARNEILKPLEENIGTGPAESQFRNWVERAENLLGADNPENKLSLQKLHELRQDVSKQLYGIRGDLTISSEFKSALHDVRNVISDEINQGLDKAALEGADRAAWKAANREYSVAATINRIAEKGMTGQGLSGIPLSALITGGAGLVHGGPLGAAAMGAGAMLAKRYGPQVLAKGARAMRQLVDHEGAEAVVNKTAELIAQERAAGEGVAGNWLGRAVEHGLEKAEPLAAPLKDVSREHLVERVAGESRKEPETVAALSHLQKANHEVDKRIDELAGHLVSGKGKHTAKALAAETTAEQMHGVFQQRAEQLRQMASNADVTQKRLEQLASDVNPHAPQTAQAMQISAARAVAHLSQKLPPVRKAGPLGPTLKPNSSERAAFSRAWKVANEPTSVLKHAAAGTLTPDMVETAKTVAPALFAKMQQAALTKVTEHKGPLPYKSRLGLRMLLGQDLDGTTTPQAIQAAQAVYHLPSAKSGADSTGPGAVRTSQTGLSKLNSAGRAMLPGQSRDMRTGGR